jgi:hypothetical protein
MRNEMTKSLSEGFVKFRAVLFLNMLYYSVISYK